MKTFVSILAGFSFVVTLFSLYASQFNSGWVVCAVIWGLGTIGWISICVWEFKK